MQQWEYRVIETGKGKAVGILEEELARAGASGWELVSATSSMNTSMTRVVTRLFLKRPLS